MSLESLIAGGLISRDVPLGPMTTYKSGGPARFFAEPEGIEQLQQIAGAIDDMPILMLGRGSNLVVSDRGFDGIVIRLGKGFREFEITPAEVTAGAALSLPVLARASVDQSRTGLEFFVGVPGSVGGAVRQNAGCFGHETKDVLIRASVLDLSDGAVAEMDVNDLDLAYRHSNLTAGQVVVAAKFEVSDGDREASRAELRRITRWRKENQPGGTLNAGSVFKNPEGAAAGEIIDRLGLKGLRHGDVAVSTKHANFFVAGPRATSAEIIELVRIVKDRVFEETGTILVPEIQFVGFEEWQ